MTKPRKQKPTMSDIISDSKASPSKAKQKRLPPGVHNEVFVDKDGSEYQLVEETVAPSSGLGHLAAGAQVVFDECGCGGTCGLNFSTDIEMLSLAKTIPVLETHKGQTGSLSLWKSATGKQLLLAQGPVRWS